MAVAQSNGNGRQVSPWVGHGLTILAIAIAGIASYGTFAANSAVTNSKVDGLILAQSKTDGKVDALGIEQARTSEQLKALTARVDEMARARQSP